MTTGEIYFSIALGVATGALGAYLAQKKGRTHNFGFIIGFLFGFIGLIILLFLQAKTTPNQEADSDQKN